MPNPCDGCAYADGAAANLEPDNRLKALVCALTGVPFWCHHGMNWQTTPKHLSRAEFQALNLHICEGWRREVSKRIKPGLAGKRRRLIRRWKGEAALMLIDEFIALEPGPEKDEALERLQSITRKL